MNSPKIIAKYISCLSDLEEEIAVLYSSLSGRAETPLIKSLLLSISQDSSKHSTLLKGVASSISDSKEKLGNCEKNLGEVWKIVSNYHKEIKKKGNGKLSFTDLLPKLNALESSIGEEYYMFVQMKTLQLMVKEINQLYNINLASIKKIFEGIIKDEEHHREILATIKDIINNASKKLDSTPKVRYQNPDSWISSLPPTTY